jgi:hypothetical protein
MTPPTASSGDAAARGRGGPPVWFAVFAGIGLLAGVVILLFELLGVGVRVGAPGADATPPPAGAAAQLTHDRVALALQAASFQVQDPQVPFRTGETATLLATPRTLLQAVLPADPQHGFIVIYEFADNNAADAAGREFLAYLHSGTGGIGYPQDAQFVLRRIGQTLIFFPWSPAVSPDPSVTRLASVLSGLGSPITGQ